MQKLQSPVLEGYARIIISASSMKTVHRTLALLRPADLTIILTAVPWCQQGPKNILKKLVKLGEELSLLLVKAR